MNSENYPFTPCPKCGWMSGRAGHDSGIMPHKKLRTADGDFDYSREAFRFICPKCRTVWKDIYQLVFERQESAPYDSLPMRER